MFIDPDGERGLAEQVYVQVRDAIDEGRLVAGDVLTPSRTLAAQLGISRFTVSEAYARLSAEGYVGGRRRGGTVVTSAVPSMPSVPASYPSRGSRLFSDEASIVSLWLTSRDNSTALRERSKPPSNVRRLSESA